MSYEVWLLGALGGSLTDVLRVARLYKANNPPSKSDWGVVGVSAIFSALLGAIAAGVVGGGSTSQNLAIGFSGPEVLMRLLGPVPANTGPDPGPGGAEAGPPSATNLARYLST